MTLPLMRTGRLVLEPFAPGDLDELHALWTDAEVRRFLWDGLIIPRSRASGPVAPARLLSAMRDGRL